MKIVNIIGGLGNQLFQYAFAVALKKHYPDEEVLIDTSHFKGYGLHNGFELPTVIGELDLPIANKKDIAKVSRYIPNYKLSRICRRLLPQKTTEYIEPLYYVYHPEVFSIEGDCYYEGYWQAAPYYKDCKQDIMQRIQFGRINEYSQRMLNVISMTNSVAVHIRRGDYLKDPDYAGICNLDYYRKAIEEIAPKNREWFIFSNDRQWCESYIFPLLEEAKDVHFIDGNTGRDSYCDMLLMSKCNNMILANSSFSWWGAYMNEEANRIIAPRPWINRKQRIDIYMPGWEYV